MNRALTVAVLVLGFAASLAVAQTGPFEIYYTNGYPRGTDDSLYQFHGINGLTTVYARPPQPDDLLIYFEFAPWDEDLLYYVNPERDRVYMTDLGSTAPSEMLAYVHEDLADPSGSHEQVRCLAFDSSGSLYVSDFSWPPEGRSEDLLGRIWRVDPSAGPAAATLLWTVTRRDTGWVDWNGHFTLGPDDTIYISEGNLVASGNPSSIYSIDFTTNTLVSVFDDNDPYGSVCGMAFGPDGFLYYADYNNRVIWRLDPSTGVRTPILTTSTRVMDVGFRGRVPVGGCACTPCGFGMLPTGPIGPVFTQCGAAFMGQPLSGSATNLQILDMYPADGVSELFVSAGKLAIVFPTGVSCVEITYAHYNSGEFLARDETGAVVDSRPFEEEQDTIHRVVLERGRIYLVEIDGSEFSIIDVCAEP